LDHQHQVVVFEDAVAGVRAGKAAGATVIAVLETHSREGLAAAGADYIITGLDKVHASKADNGEIIIHLED
jgi:beta-phosphoglucomutase-like phosphatase (HAD superfamily)